MLNKAKEQDTSIVGDARRIRALLAKRDAVTFFNIFEINYDADSSISTAGMMDLQIYSEYDFLRPLNHRRDHEKIYKNMLFFSNVVIFFTNLFQALSIFPRQRKKEKLV